MNNMLNKVQFSLSVILMSAFAYYFITNNQPRWELLGLGIIILVSVIIERKRHRKCSKCSAVNNVSQNFCGHCGIKLNDHVVVA